MLADKKNVHLEVAIYMIKVTKLDGIHYFDFSLEGQKHCDTNFTLGK